MQSPPNPHGPRKPVAPVPPIPEMVAATSEPFYVGAEPVQITLELHAPKGPALFREGVAEREVFLMIENFWCDKPAPPFRVYLNVPPGDEPEDHPELRVGNLGTFGLLQQSDPQGEHGGEGITFSLDITGFFTRLAATKTWDSRYLRVTFSPGYWKGTVPPVNVGRVSLYFK